jgi:peptidyl-prolyl cis-trans isomerase SurA
MRLRLHTVAGASWRLASAVAAALGLLAVRGAVAAAPPEPVLLDGVAAYVNGQVITVGEVMRVLAPELARLRSAYSEDALLPRLREKYKERLQALIDSRLVLKAFEAKPEEINAARLEREVERRYQEFVRDQFGGDRDAFVTALREEGLQPEQWRTHLRESLILSFMRQREVDAHVIVSPAEVRAAYEARRAVLTRPEQVHLRLMLFKGGATEAARADALRRAEAARQRVAGGADFGVVAKEVSEDPKAAAGGDWGWVAPQDLRAELAGALTGLVVNATSAAVEAEGDGYLLRVEERRAGGVVPFEEARQELERDLREKEAQRLHQAWMAQLRRGAFVDVRPETPFDDD